jgi:hypothetical protein
LHVSGHLGKVVHSLELAWILLSHFLWWNELMKNEQDVCLFENNTCVSHFNYT